MCAQGVLERAFLKYAYVSYRSIAKPPTAQSEFFPRFSDGFSQHLKWGGENTYNG